MDNYEPAAEIKKQDTAKQSRKAGIARQALDMEFMPRPRIRGKARYTGADIRQVRAAAGNPGQQDTHGCGVEDRRRP